MCVSISEKGHTLEIRDVSEDRFEWAIALAYTNTNALTLNTRDLTFGHHHRSLLGETCSTKKVTSLQVRSIKYSVD